MDPAHRGTGRKTGRTPRCSAPSRCSAPFRGSAPSRSRAPLPSRQPPRHEAILSRRDERVTAPTPPSPARRGSAGDKQEQGHGHLRWDRRGNAAARRSKAGQRGGGARGGRRTLTCSSPIREGLKSCWELGRPGDPPLRASPAAAAHRSGRTAPAARPAGAGAGAAGTRQPAAAHGLQITPAPPAASLPIRAAGKACGLLGSSSALQLDVCEGFFPAGKQSPEPWRAAAGSGAVGARSPGEDAAAGMGMSAQHVRPPRWLSPLRWMLARSRGSGGAGEGSGAFSPTLRTRPIFPRHGPSPGWVGGVASTRPPTCHKSPLRAGDVLCPKR